MRFRFLLVLVLLAGCGPRRYFMVSHDADYSQDPSLTIHVVGVSEPQKGRTEVDVQLDSRRTEPLPLAELKTVLLDPRSRECPLVSAPTGELAAGASRTISLVYDTGARERGEYSMRLVLPVAPSTIGPNHHETRIWPIVFTTKRP